MTLPALGADLRGKAALVTGSSRGIGAAVARGFGAARMRIAVHYRGSQSRSKIIFGFGKGVAA